MRQQRLFSWLCFFITLDESVCRPFGIVRQLCPHTLTYAKSRQNISYWVEKNEKDKDFLRIAQIRCLDFGHFDQLLMVLAGPTDEIVFKIIRGWLDFKFDLIVRAKRTLAMPILPCPPNTFHFLGYKAMYVARGSAMTRSIRGSQGH